MILKLCEGVLAEDVYFLLKELINNPESMKFLRVLF